jgi:hypothetical protein
MVDLLDRSDRLPCRTRMGLPFSPRIRRFRACVPRSTAHAIDMRRHAGVLARQSQNQQASRGWRPSPGLVSLSLSGVIVLVNELENRDPATRSNGGQVFIGVLAWLVFAAAIRLVILVGQQCRQLVGRRDTSGVPEQ